MDNSTTTDSDGINVIGHEFYAQDILLELPALRYVMVALHIFMIIVAAFGNGALIYIILRNWRKHSNNVTVYLILNLVVTELLRTMFHQPLRLRDILRPDVVLTNHDVIYCKTSGFFTAFFSCVAFHTIVGISQERLLLICFPLRAKGILTVEITRNIVISIWLLAFLASLPLPFFFSFVASISFEQNSTRFCFIDVVTDSGYRCTYYFFLFVVYYAIPVVAITTSYSCIFYTLNQGISGTDNTDETIQHVLAVRKKLSKIMLSIAVIFTLFHGPYFLTFFCLCLGVEIHKNPMFLLLIIEFLQLISSALTPFTYTAYSALWPNRRKRNNCDDKDIE